MEQDKNPLGIKGLHHLGIVPRDLVQAKWFFSQVLSLPFLGSEDVSKQGVSTHVYQTSLDKSASPNQGRVELLESLNREGVIAQFLEKKGGGIHHLAIEVENIERLIENLKGHKIEFIGEKPGQGTHQTKVIFVHPRSTGGILVEFVEALPS